MYARVVCVALFTILCVCEELEYENLDILSSSKVELTPLEISAGLHDIVILSAPIITSETLYYLSKPNGDTSKLNLSVNNTLNYDISNLKVKKIITPNKENIFNANDNFCTDFFVIKEKALVENDFIIGPLLEEDHGNWVLSAYYFNEEWIEEFQVITIEIKESIPAVPLKPKLSIEEDLELRFAYPIKDIESCEIVAPKSTFDRFFDRDRKYFDYCGFRIPNVTKHDEGIWKIIGVGRIVYEARVYLAINDK